MLIISIYYFLKIEYTLVNNMKIYLATDHAGFYLKEIVKSDLEARGFVVEDFGATSYGASDDYPDFIFPCVKQYIKETGGNFEKGFCIILGGSGTGEAIVANRIKGVRAVVCNQKDISSALEIVKLGRQHNNANVLSIGARFLDEKQALEAIKTFQTTLFEGGRHQKRVFKIDYLA
jgi:ribose 5-phosphate isomerase B